MIKLLNRSAPSTERLQEVGKGLVKAKPDDFKLNPEGESLIHYAAFYDNLSLFKECLKHTPVDTLDFWKNTPLLHAFRGKATKMLTHFATEHQVEIKSVKDGYGSPAWWSGITKYKCEEESFKNYINFLKKHGVDFNERNENSYGETLAFELFRSYKFSALAKLFKYADVDVNLTARADHPGMTLAHWCAFMEDARALAFKRDPDSQIDEVFDHILKSCNPYAKTESGNDVLSYMCRLGYHRYAINKLLTLQNLTLTPTQHLWLNREQVGEIIADKQKASIYEELIFFKTQDIQNGVFKLIGEPLIKGLHDKDISSQPVKSIRQLKGFKETLIEGQAFYSQNFKY